MANLSTAPFVPFRQFDSSGLLLTGGKIYFYRAGSTTPLETYQDSAGTIANTNPVILDASGVANIYLLPAKYRVEIYDANDVLIHEQDDIGTGIGSSAVLGGVGSIAICANYDALRNLSDDYDIVIVLGRDNPNDGGYGIFLQSDSVGADDDAVLLTRQGTTRYIRQMAGYIDPLWTGLVYNTANDQFSAFSDTLALGIAYKLPIIIADNLYLQTNITIPTDSRLIINGSLYGPAGSPPTVTFDNGAILESCSTAGLRLPISFGVGCVRQSISSSWFAGGDDIELTRISTISTGSYTVNIDKVYSLGQSINFPANLALDFVGASRFVVDIGGLSINIANLKYNGTSKIIDYTDISYVGTISLGGPVRPEWFGAVGDGTTDDSDAFVPAVHAGAIILSTRYKVVTPITHTGDLAIYGALGAGVLALPSPMTDTPNPTLYMVNSAAWLHLTGQLTIDGIGIYCDGGTGLNIIGSDLFISNSVIYTNDLNAGIAASDGTINIANSFVLNDSILYAQDAVSIYYDNVRVDTDPTARMYRQNTKLKDTYLLNIPSAKSLSTDADGKIIGSDNIAVVDASVSTLNITSKFEMSQKVVATSTYTVQDNDPPILVFTYDGGNVNITLPASAGSNGSKIRMFVKTGIDYPMVITGDLWFLSTLGTAGGPTRVPGLITINNPTHWAYYVNGKWAMG